MMGKASTIEKKHSYSESERIHVYYANFVRNSRAIALMWILFTFCLFIINVIVFVQPQWIGDTDESPGTGYFGLTEYCELFQSGTEFYCRGGMFDFTAILNPAFRASAIFVGVSIVAILICICCMILFFFTSAYKVFIICGVFQSISAILMLLGCVIFPVGWNDSNVRRVCGGETDQFVNGNCGIRWAYILAMIGIFDAAILAILAFVLASRQAKLFPSHLKDESLLAKGINGYEQSGSDSHRSVGIVPVMHAKSSGTGGAVSNVDHFSDYSHTSQRSKRAATSNFSL